MSVWREGYWFDDLMTHTWFYFPPGDYELFKEFPREKASHAVSYREMESLIRALDESGWLKPKLEDKVRQDDLKIVHRLIDLLEKR